MKVIVGLGNPGKKYSGTRHNAGYDVIDKLSGEFGVELIIAKHKGLMQHTIVRGEKVMLVKPVTYMNLSGECVLEIKRFYKLDNDDIIIIYDDSSIPLGSVRVREKGADGGHKGMKSIISHLGGSDFSRVRVGIGAPPDGWDLADYVLAAISGDDKSEYERSVMCAADCVKLILDGAVDRAMNKYNKRIKANNEEAAGGGE